MLIAHCISCTVIIFSCGENCNLEFVLLRILWSTTLASLSSSDAAVCLYNVSDCQYLQIMDINYKGAISLLEISFVK